MARRSSELWSSVTPLLLFSCFCLLVGDILFGYDTASFGGILANPGFVNQFGQYDSSSQSYAFDSVHTSLMSSLPFIGKFIGCFSAGPAIELFGHRVVFFGLAIISLIGILVEMTAAGTSEGSGRFAQFVVGRIIVYISVGLVEVDVTTYQSEIVPASFRGLVVVSLQLFLNAGTVLASGVNKALSTRADSVGWRTVTGVQFIFPVLLILFTFFIPNSPRWLLSKDREDEAIASLRRLRPNFDTMEGNCESEIQEIKAGLHGNIHKGSWLDLVNGNNLRRTIIVVVYYFFQQTTGQAFVSTYQTTFYKQNGYANEAFTYPIINSCLGFIAVLPAMCLVDSLGRRGTLLLTFFFQGLFMFLLAGIGSLERKSSSENNTVVAAFMLYYFSYNLGGASTPYLLGTEIPSAALREKTQSLGTAWNVLWGFVTNFVIPYIIENIHFMIGWVFGGLSLLALIFTFFFLPETKGRTLEESEALFEVRFNPFKSVEVLSTDAEMNTSRLEGSANTSSFKKIQEKGDFTQVE